MGERCRRVADERFRDMGYGEETGTYPTLDDYTRAFAELQRRTAGGKPTMARRRQKKQIGPCETCIESGDPNTEPAKGAYRVSTDKVQCLEHYQASMAGEGTEQTGPDTERDQWLTEQEQS